LLPRYEHLLHHDDRRAAMVVLDDLGRAGSEEDVVDSVVNAQHGVLEFTIGLEIEDTEAPWRRTAGQPRSCPPARRRRVRELQVAEVKDGVVREMSMPSRSLALLLSYAPTAAAYRYGAMDSLGHRMDTAKVIQSPVGGYLVVYHSGAGSVTSPPRRPGDVDAPWGHRRAGDTASDRHGAGRRRGQASTLPLAHDPPRFGT